jgi:uncharacterized protein YdaT
MKWNEQNYPAIMKNLEPHIREKAIEIANSLLDDGHVGGRTMPEARVIAIAISTAIAKDSEYSPGKFKSPFGTATRFEPKCLW